jgi:plasminogen activator
LLNFTVGASKGPWAINLALSTAVTTGTGIMEDYDWGDSTITDWTNWSESLIFVDKSIFLDISTSYTYKLNNHFSFPVELGYKLNYLDWEDKSGDYIYYWDFLSDGYYIDPDTPVTGSSNGVNGIDYMVIQNIFYVSYGVYYSVGDISAGLDLALSPYINAWDLDHHILRNLYFMDTFDSFFWYRVDFSLNLKTNTNTALVINLFIEELPETVGDTYQYNEDSTNSEEVGTQTGYYSNGAGLASILWGIGLSYIWTF